MKKYGFPAMAILLFVSCWLGTHGVQAAEADKSIAQLNVSNNDLITIILKKDFEFGGDENKQVISISKDEIQNFTIEKNDSDKNGGIQVYICSFILKKKHASFIMRAQFIYNYDKLTGWKVSSITITPKINSIDIEGDWNGEGGYYHGKINLNIQKVAEDGSISAVAKPESIGLTNGPCSFKMRGNIDMKTLRVAIKGYEWVKKPQYHSERDDTWPDWNGYLSIDNSAIKGVISGSRMQSSPFEVRN